jgi:hypothetical protein
VLPEFLALLERENLGMFDQLRVERDFSQRLAGGENVSASMYACG